MKPIYRIIGSCLIIAFMSGCVAIPTYLKSENSRHNTEKDDVRFIKVGKTNRATIILRLGEPDGIKDDASKMYYRSSRDVVTAIPLTQDADSAPLVQRHRYFKLEFDANGVVTSAKFTTDLDWVF